MKLKDFIEKVFSLDGNMNTELWLCDGDGWLCEIDNFKIEKDEDDDIVIHTDVERD